MENLIIINVPNNLNSKSDFKIGFNVSFRVCNPRFTSGYGVFEK